MVQEDVAAVDGATQVLVVGAGPAGLVTALVLARQGVDVLVVEKRAGTSPLSRALAVSTRSMEIFRSWGIEERVRAGAADVELRAWVSRTLASDDGHEMSLGYPAAAEIARVSPAPPAWVPQDQVEPLLLDLLLAEPRAIVRFGVELVGLAVDAEGVHADLRDRGTDRSWRVHPAYAVGADGAHSTVREAVGIAMVGSDDLGEYERVEFRAPLEELIGARRYGLYVVTDPDVGAVLAPRGSGGRWGLSRERRPDQRSVAELRDEELVYLVRRATGGADLPVEVERTSAFSFAAQLAERYRHGRVFLVGDAAHRMTPRGGTGMNTAVQDGFDLGWKLGWVLRGWAAEALLETYESERRPVGQHNVERSADPGGARRDVEDALPWDLDGRIAHHWVVDGEVSTLDLVGEGLTLLTGPDDGGWAGAAQIGAAVPLEVHRLDAATADALGLGDRGAVLVRPDAQEVGRWEAPVAPLPAGLPVRRLRR